MRSLKNIYFYYPKESVSAERLSQLTQACKDNGFNIVEADNEADVVICIGDDGVYLQGVRHTGFRSDCLYIGISEEDQAGLYEGFLLDDYQEMFDTLKQETFEVQNFPLIDVSINGATPFYCLNEASIRSSIIKTIAIDVYIDDRHFERFRGDGLIVATPTGSAGYNKSTQGAILDPAVPCFQLTELASLNNNHYRTLGSSLILAENKTLRLEVIQDGNDYPIIGLDNEAYSIRNIQHITLTMSGKSIQTIKLPGDTYWDRLKHIFL
ncbi:NAD kinase 2 [Paraliobacillus quinghaiensis]|uniref:NAD kinase n=1 Tax=Paraliobacillus quinghaiensis TaxID=470815 RepID=A0A917WT43_9BACI|nr:NAD kinase [Paraliobacillus quinghaiensis]GGM26510.1 NAD kinase 2 [Paraliobacillus quinghaiensis]